jgi:hypothetical protein
MFTASDQCLQEHLGHSELETAFLRTGKNAARLLEAIQDIKQLRNVHERTLIEH